MNYSLHPKLCRFLIRLFHNPKSNPKNTQLIFATHETTLLDNSLFRTDQIWFTEKNKFGETELFSASDFEGIQNNAPLQNWYLAGKFDAQPHIKEIEFIYGTT
jgi:AAA15 family ATPase/GTPase